MTFEATKIQQRYGKSIQLNYEMKYSEKKTLYKAYSRKKHRFMIVKIVKCDLQNEDESCIWRKLKNCNTSFIIKYYVFRWSGNKTQVCT